MKRTRIILVQGDRSLVPFFFTESRVIGCKPLREENDLPPWSSYGELIFQSIYNRENRYLFLSMRQSVFGTHSFMELGWNHDRTRPYYWEDAVFLYLFLTE